MWFYVAGIAVNKRTRIFISTCLLAVIAVLGGCGGGGGSAGNAVLDNLRPSIVSITPDDGASGVDVVTSIRITFSEPMDRKSVEAAFDVSPVLAGRFVWSQNDTVLTFIPDRALDYHTKYSLAMTTGSADRAGNRLRAIMSTNFTSGGASPVPLASIKQPAAPADADMVFNNNGDAVAAWTSDTSGTLALSYAFHNVTTGQWGASQTISAVKGYRIATNGNAFALAWSDSSGMHAVRITGGSASAPVAISGTPGYQLQLVSNGAGYALAWTSDPGNGNPYASVYRPGAGWSAVKAFTCPGPKQCWTSRNVKLASDGSGYAVAWLEPDFVSNIMASLYQDDGSGSDAWLVPQIIGADVDNAQVKLVLTSSGQGYAAAWHTWHWVPGTFRVYANVHNGSFWGAVQRLDTTDDAADPVITSDDNGYAVAWRHVDTSTGISEINASLYRDDGGGFSWNSPDLLGTVDGDMTAPVINSNGQGYAVAWTQTAVCSGCGRDVYAGIYDAGLWSGSVMLNASELPASGVTLDNESVRLASNGQGYAAAWLHDDSASGSSLKINTFDTDTWVGETFIDTGNSAVARLVVNNDLYAAIWSRAVTGGDNVMANVAF